MINYADVIVDLQAGDTGRPVYNVRENERLIYVYSDGRRIKQMIK